MPNAYIATDGTLGVSFYKVDASPTFRVGQIVEGNNNSEWVYAYAQTALSAGFVAQMDTSFNGNMITTANAVRGNVCGVPVVAIAAGSYGWVQRRGPAPALQVAASTAANTKMNTTTTAGQIGTDATTGSKQLDGPYITTAQGSGGAGQQAGQLVGISVGATN